MATIILVDVSKALASIDRRTISIVLSKHGVSELLVANLIQLYIRATSIEVTALRNTETFSAASGILQGDTLTPYPFITLLGNIDDFTIIPRRSFLFTAVRIGAPVYSDDIAHTCDTIGQAEYVFQRLEVNASKVGLKINFKKREFCTLDIVLSHVLLQR